MKPNNLSYLMKSFFMINEFSSVTRYSKNRPMIQENDLEHTGWVALWSYLTAVDIQNKFDVQIDFAKLLSQSICHDLDETITGDILRPTKYANQTIEEEIKKTEAQAVCQIADFFTHFPGIGKRDLFTDWIIAKEIETLEGLTVKVADIMSVVYKTWQEVLMMNNFCFISIAYEVKSALLPLSQELKEDPGALRSLHKEEICLYFSRIIQEGINLLEKCIEKAPDGTYIKSPF